MYSVARLSKFCLASFYNLALRGVSAGGRSSKQRGFTLIELSIVLVIIGLIIGGVLMGKDLIRTAELRSQVKQFEQYQAAVNTFRVKYNCEPGRCENGLALGLGAQYEPTNNDFFSSPARLCGDNGGLNTEICDAGDESIFFTNLRMARLIKDSPIGGNANQASLKGAGLRLLEGYFYQRNKLYLVLADFSNSGGIAGSPILSTLDALYFDQKMDDGLPDTGKIYATGPIDDPSAWDIRETSDSEPTYNLGASGDPVCISNSTTPNTYNTEVTSGKLCAIGFEILN